VLDLNLHVAGLLDDLAAVQTSMYPRKAYERAARKVMLLPEPLHEGLPLPDIGKTATAVIREMLATGTSKTVSRAIDGSTRVADVEARRHRREGFLSLAIARRVLAAPAPGAVGRDGYRGDFQMHTTWSDGSRTIAEMAIGCAERGYTHFAVTDHAEGLSIAQGLSADRVAEQHAEIVAINESTRGRLTVIQGLEGNILADGTVDCVSASRATGAPGVPQMVLAAPHSKLDSAETQTGRLVTAVSTPGVHILAHPSGRKFGKRDGLKVDWATVFAAAKANNVAIEIDGDPSRQDLPYALARQAYDAGCLIALDSDAHDTDELCFSDIALAHARLARIPPARVINTWTTKKLLTWLKR
jgi:histidinol phosphatase-like PHP family hydrolase